MSKAVLVMDMPNNCSECPFFYCGFIEMHCRAIGNKTIYLPYPKGSKPIWCPLKEVPDKEEGVYLREWTNGYKTGWNDYREAILEEVLYEED